MGWQEARKRYQEAETTTDQKIEDLVARRVLRGLGLVQRNLPTIERMCYDESYPDEAIWVRTERIVKRVGQLKGFPVNFDYVLCETTPAHKEPFERLEMFDGKRGLRPVILTRLKGSTQSLAYSVWWDNELTAFLDPPYTVLKRQGECLIAVQDTEKFFAQLEWGDAFIGVA